MVGRFPFRLSYGKKWTEYLGWCTMERGCGYIGGDDKVSLSSLINKDKGFKEILQSVEPPKESFYTLSGKKPFSDEYISRVPSAMKNVHQASLLGTAFDYMARLRIAKLKKDKEVTQSFRAMGGMRKLLVLPDGGRLFQEKYKPWIETVRENMQSRESIESLYEIAVHMAKLEQIYRGAVEAETVDLDSIFNQPAPDDIRRELEGMMEVFEETFMTQELLKKKKSIYYSPEFGIGSLLVGGADADILIDGTLYDFKTTKEHSGTKRDLLQLMGYFLLNELSYHAYSEEHELGSHHYIDRLAFYKGRFGEVEYFEPYTYLTPETLKEKIIQLADYLKDNERNLLHFPFADIKGAKRSLAKVRKGEFDITFPLKYQTNQP
jgi:hypothetical protein